MHWRSLSSLQIDEVSTESSVQAQYLLRTLVPNAFAGKTGVPFQAASTTVKVKVVLVVRAK